MGEPEGILRGVFAQAPVGMCLAALEDFRWTQVNPALCSLLGYSQEQLLGIGLDQITHRDDIESSLEGGRRLREGEIAVYVAEKRYVHAEGHVVRVSVSVSLLRDEQDAPHCFIVQVLDIGARKAAEEALRDAEERFRRSFDEAPIGMALVSLDGHWMKVNDALCDIVGYAADQLMRLRFQDITHADDLSADEELVRQMIAGERSAYEMLKRYLHADGRIVWVQLNVSLARDGSGRALYFISQIQDVTGRRESEKRRVSPPA